MIKIRSNRRLEKRAAYLSVGRACLVVFAVALVQAASPDAAHALDLGCAMLDADIFRSARRARSIVADYNRLHRIYRADLARNRAFLQRETGKDLTWRFDLAGVFSNTSTFDFDVCTNRGRWDASLGAMRGGGLASVDFYQWGFGVEAFAIFAGNSLSAYKARRPDGSFQDPTSVATLRENEAIYGARLTLHDWASLVVGWVNTGAIDSQPGKYGREFDIGWVDPGEGQHAYMGLASPYGDTRLHLFYEPDGFRSNLVALRAEALPLPVDLDALGIAGLSLIEDESQFVLTLGLAEVWDFLLVDAEFEIQPARLRKVRARAEYMGSFEHIARTEDTDPAPEVDTSGVLRVGLDLGAFAEMTYFNSLHLYQHTDREHVLGTNFGITLRPDLTILMLQIDTWFGINRPDELARISDFVDHWQVGLRVHTRLGL